MELLALMKVGSAHTIMNLWIVFGCGTLRSSFLHENPPTKLSGQGPVSQHQSVTITKIPQFIAQSMQCQFTRYYSSCAHIHKIKWFDHVRLRL